MVSFDNRMYAVMAAFVFLAVVVTVTNVRVGGPSSTIVDHYEPAVGLGMLNDSYVNINVANFDRSYGMRIYRNRILEIAEGGYARPDYIIYSDKREGEDKVPEVFRSLIGSDSTNVNVKMDDGSEAIYGFKASGMQITDINVGGYSGAAYTIRTDEGTVVYIASQRRPLNATEQMYREGKVRMGANNPIAGIKLFVVDAVFRLFG
jgi:hypothetical protein